jgi:hypothetical protein
MIYCEGENEERPDDEFETLPKWGLSHVRNVEKRHTIGGYPIDASSESTPLPMSIPPEFGKDEP